MDYQKIYDQLIENRRKTPLPDGEYGERHHVIPKSEGGSDDKTNIVKLTAKEHYVAHHLLIKIYRDCKMYSALLMMSVTNGDTHQRDYRFTARMYNHIKTEFGSWNRGIPWTPEMRKHALENRKGFLWYTDGETEVLSKVCPEGFHRGRSPLGAEKRSQIMLNYYKTHDNSRKGQKMPKEYGEKIRAARKKFFDSPAGDEYRQKRSVQMKEYYKTHKGSFKGRKHSEESKRKMWLTRVKQMKPVIAWYKDTMEKFGEFESINAAARACGVSAAGVSQVLHGGATYAGNFTFKFAS